MISKPTSSNSCILSPVAMDENLHFLFYRDMASAIIEIDPSQAVEAMERQIVGFTMPGDGIPGFREHAKIIANAGIYDLAAHYELILEPIVLRHWDLPNLTGLTAEADQARERTMAYIEKSKKVADRLVSRRQARAEAENEGRVSVSV
ncbi:MAG: acyl-ACP desaturase [Actinomycetota bacterium]